MSISKTKRRRPLYPSTSPKAARDPLPPMQHPHGECGDVDCGVYLLAQRRTAEAIGKPVCASCTIAIAYRSRREVSGSSRGDQVLQGTGYRPTKTYAVGRGRSNR